MNCGIKQGWLDINNNPFQEGNKGKTATTLTVVSGGSYCYTVIRYEDMTPEVIAIQLEALADKIRKHLVNKEEAK